MRSIRALSAQEGSLFGRHINLLMGLLLGVGCSKSAPSGFWKDFPSAKSQYCHIEGGLRGGWCAIDFVPETGGAIQGRAVEVFAEKNGWKLKSRQHLTAKEIGAWSNPVTGAPVFPLGYSGFKPGVNDVAYNNFPLWIKTDATLLVFDTGWITAMGGVERPAMGYALVSDDGTALSIYHLWGE